MGTYRHLMIYFCCSSMFFSFMDIIVQPYIHTYKSAFFMIAECKNSGVDRKVAEVLIGILCACFSVTIYGIAIHFVYRYFALERETVKEFFDLEIEDSAYCGAAFYLPDQTGKSVIHKNSFYGFFVYIGIMSIPFMICMVAGWKSWKKVRDLKDYGESDYSKSLQLQLYKALVAQVGLRV
ncbi:hypothetical protein CAEBREN_10641 [Caenorhabditis brenneri]|uniref:Uncharacterized protein n=1 Tax=Caenorhabditis brenneri TaxID=135651 RepID=G0PAV2_CAEBE|nr:hypothetical protein CAEBREN_10641 [Caenorhabditis brenneri]